MKTAIICDWLTTLGGAEKCLEQFLQCFPEADVFSVVDFIDKENCSFLDNRQIKTTFIQKMPFAKKHYRHYLPLMPLAIEQLDLSSYDLVLSSSHAVAKGVITGPNQVHISYVHSPMRYAWDLQHQYLNESGLSKKPHGWLVRYLLHRLRLWDYRSANGVDHFIANSKYIAKRIEKTYRRPADVIYPPVDTNRFQVREDKEDFYFAASRLVPYKKMDLIVESFAQMPNKKLIVIGDGPDRDKLKSKLAPNIQYLGYQDNATLVDHMQRAKAFVFAAEEDFGITPVEAQACGTPVIAFGRGGALETVNGIESPEPTGLFFKEQTPKAIQAAVCEFESNKNKITAENCRRNAERFSPERFRKEILNYVQQQSNRLF